MIDRLLKVATPLTALTVVVPLRLPPLGFVPIATVIDAVLLVTVFPRPSTTFTATAGLMLLPAIEFVGGWLKASAVAVPGVMAKVLLVELVRPLLDAVSV